MISADLRVEGFDARSWTNLVSLFAPPVRRRAERVAVPGGEGEGELDLEKDAAGRALGTLFVVVSARGRVRKAFHTTRGRVKGVTYDGPRDLERLAAQARARRAVAIREGTLEEVGQRIERRAARTDDYVSSWLQVLRAFRESIDDGSIHVWPPLNLTMPVPTPGMVRRALDLALPDETAMTLAVFDGDGLWTAAALRRRAGEIDWIAGPDLITKWAGPLGGDWRRDHRAVSDAVARYVAPVHVGIFADAEDLQALLRSTEPGAWLKAIVTRDVIVQPTPPYVAVALGADAMRAVAKRSRDVLGGLDALSVLGPVVRALRGQKTEVGSVTATLGFDPLKWLAGWLERHDPEEGEADAPPAEESSEPGTSGRPIVRIVEDDGDDEDVAHGEESLAEVLPFPIRRSSAPPPADDEDDDVPSSMGRVHLVPLGGSDGEDE